LHWQGLTQYTRLARHSGEYLADAQAVQFSRNTWALASVLDKVSDKPDKPALYSRYTGQLEQLCFQGPWEDSVFGRWLASHPEPESRIKLIEPHFRVKARKQSERQSAGSSETTTTASAGNGTAGRTIVPIPAVAPAAAFQSIHSLSTELSVVLSLLVASSGHKKETLETNYTQILKCYTSEPIPMRAADEPGISEEFEQALDGLLNQPAAQRQALLDHITEIVEQDGISMPEEKQMLAHINARLNPPADAA